MRSRDALTTRPRGRRGVAAGAAVALALAVAGCGGVIQELTGPPTDLYTLTPKSTFTTGLPQVAWQLVVEEPIASGGLNVQRIALRTHPTELKYFAQANWTERAPRMVQTLLVESFENSGAIVAVGRQAIGLRSDYNLKSELREFQAEYMDGARVPTVRVRLNAKLIRQPQRTIIGSRNFEAVQQATGTDMRSIVAAFDDALGKVLRQTVEWTLKADQLGAG